MIITEYKATKFKELNLVSKELDANKEELATRLASTIYNEAPISEGLLERRVIQSMGMKKIGRLIQELLDDFLPTLGFKHTTYKGVRFYWRDEDNPLSCDLIRKTGDENNRRDAKDVPIEEAMNAIRYAQDYMSGEDEVIREAARIMGYTRLGSVVLPLFLDAYNKVNK